MTACYATDRRRAIHRLGDYFDCCCHPEVMNALVYALNDSDERVRAKAADEIGDQIRRNRCCCGSPVIRALTHALADCDRHVRRQAEEALQASGYKIVDGCCRRSFAASCGSVWSRFCHIGSSVSQPEPVESSDVPQAEGGGAGVEPRAAPRQPVAVPPEQRDRPAGGTPSQKPSPFAPVEAQEPHPAVPPSQTGAAAPNPEQKTTVSVPARLHEFRPMQRTTGLPTLDLQ